MHEVSLQAKRKVTEIHFSMPIFLRYRSPLKKGGCNTHVEELRSKGQLHPNQNYLFKKYHINQPLLLFAVAKVTAGLAELKGLDLRP